MFCSNCGNKLSPEQKFCNSCGKQVERIKNNSISNQVVNKNSNSKKKRITIVALLSLLVVLIAALAIIMLLPKNDGNRTIMIYIDGSNLESDSGIVTSDLAAIKPSEIDLGKVNVLLYTGGTKEWQNNYISNQENAIFKLTKDGFKKIETYEKLNMGDPEVFASFLKYGFDNYPASKYNLIMYDHGGALDGAIYDDFTNDNLTLEDFKTALKNSPFSSNNKFDGVIFRTCLNGTLEVASIFKDYSDYIAFSEEISYGGPLSNVLGFINNVEPSDNGYIFGKKFVEQYQRQMKIIDSTGTMGATYSVVDLSKIDGIVDELNKFISGVDLSKSYSNVSKVRSNLYQYASGQTYGYDTVDLYSLISNLGNYSSVNSSNLLSKIDDAVLYNYTNMSNSKGISIYFPYNANNKLKKKFMEVYQKLDGLDDYSSFITSFYNTQTNSKSYGFNLKENETKVVDEGREVSLKLSAEEIDKFNTARYVVFERSSEHPNYYMPIYKSGNTELKDGVLKTNIGNNLVSMYNDSDNQRHIIPVMNEDVDGINTIYTPMAVLYDKTKGFGEKGFSYHVNAYLKDVDGDIKLTNAKITVNSDERLTGSLVDVSKFSSIEIWTPIYKILDENGNYTTEWESAPELMGFSSTLDDLDLKRSTLKDGEYYVVFIISDINNNTYSSNLIKVGD
ncbi:MAG: zinc-ribbon domain-containing protein [Bacilli bacterium]|nr:zinc-ribbon domain-containing protein [Bacilli bacterium]